VLSEVIFGAYTRHETLRSTGRFRVQVPLVSKDRD